MDTIWMNLENILLSRESQSWQTTYFMIPPYEYPESADPQRQE